MTKTNQRSLEFAAIVGLGVAFNLAVAALKNPTATITAIGVRSATGFACAFVFCFFAHRTALGWRRDALILSPWFVAIVLGAAVFALPGAIAFGSGWGAIVVIAAWAAGVLLAWSWHSRRQSTNGSRHRRERAA
jgi:ABC-type Fe3+-siderophore transport system permease subunit